MRKKPKLNKGTAGKGLGLYATTEKPKPAKKTKK